MVQCRTDLICGGSSTNSTMKDCCDHDIGPPGFSYIIPGVAGCQLCPVGKRKLYSKPLLIHCITPSCMTYIVANMQLIKA